MNLEELSIAGTESSDDFIALFSEKYFNKKLKDLNEDENHTIDCFGLYGCIDWLKDNNHI